MRVALINTNRIKPPIAPIALDYLAAALDAAGHHPHVLDLSFVDDVSAAITGFFASVEFDLVGFTLRNTDDCAFTSRQSFLGDFIDIVQTTRKYSNAPFVVGGVGYSIIPEAILESCGADFGVAGEGEESLIRLAQALSQKPAIGITASRHDRCRSSIDKLRHMPGLLRRESGAIVRNSTVSYTNDARLCLPPMQRRFIDNRRYYSEGGQAGIEMKRGCPMRCIYCPEPLVKGRNVRLRTPDDIVYELEQLLKQGITHIHTCDSEFNIPSSHAQAVCRAIIDRGLGDDLRLYAYCSPVPFTGELAVLMKQAGFVGINFGVDSGDAEMLKRLGRNHTPDDILRATALCRENDITVMLDLLFGGPGESEKSISRSIELMKRSGASRFGVSAGIRVYRGTVLERQLSSAGIVPDRMASITVHEKKVENIHQNTVPPKYPSFNGAKGSLGCLFGGTSIADPLFFIEPRVVSSIFEILSRCIAGDERFFFFDPSRPVQNYNYNANERLVDAIKRGFRGAYWDILRRYT